MPSDNDGGFPVSGCAPTTPFQSSSTTQTLSASTIPQASYSSMCVIPSVHRNYESRPAAHSPYHFNRTSRHSDRSSSQTCEWIKQDGSKCGKQITRKDVPEHLRATHGIMHLTRNHRILCRWSWCRRRGSTNMMNRECIVRHVREVHLHCKRSSRRRSNAQQTHPTVSSLSAS